MPQNAMSQHITPPKGRRSLANLPLNLFFFSVGALLYTPLLVLYLSGKTAGNFTLVSLAWPANYCLVALLIPCLLWWRWRKKVDIFDALFAAPTLYILIATTFYPVHAGVMDGREAAVGRADRFLHVGLMGLCLVAALLSVSYAPFRRTCKRFTDLLGLFVVVSSAYMAVSVLPVHVKKQDNNDYTAALSARHNVIVLLLDMLEGSFGSEYFRRNPAVERSFDGFVFYRNAASFAPFTALSYSGFMPGGYPGEEQMHAGSVRDAIYYKQNIIDDMVEMGYATRYFSIIPYENDNKKVVRIPDDVGLGRKGNFLLTALTMRGRYLPTGYLPFGVMYMPWTQVEFGMFSKVDARDSLKWFLQNVQVDRNMDKGFVWFHSLITHQPIRFDANGRFSMELKPDDVNGEVAYTFSLLREFLGRLEKLGVYDNSLLIIIADHGYNILQEMKELPDGAGHSLTPFGEGLYLGQYEPLIMVKKPGAHGQLRYDNSAVTLLDLRKSLREFASPGAGAGMNGFNFLGVEKGSPNRTVPVIRFVGDRFNPSKDFTSLENWRRDTLRLPLPLTHK